MGISDVSYFDPKDFTVGQLAYRLKINIVGAHALLAAIAAVGYASEIPRKGNRPGRWTLRPQTKAGKANMERLVIA